MWGRLQDRAPAVLPGPHSPSEFAQKLYAYESLNPPVLRSEEEVEPYSLQWFLNIESQRHSRHGRWIPRLLEFAKHSGESLLGLSPISILPAVAGKFVSLYGLTVEMRILGLLYYTNKEKFSWFD